MGDKPLMRSRTWPWLRSRIVGLLTAPPAGFVKVSVDDDHYRMEPVYRTRIQTELFAREA